MHTHTHTAAHTRCDEHHTLTLAVCSVVGDEGGPVVGGAEARRTGAPVAAYGVEAGGVGPTDLLSSYPTLVFV